MDRYVDGDRAWEYSVHTDTQRMSKLETVVGMYLICCLQRCIAISKTKWIIGIWFAGKPHRIFSLYNFCFDKNIAVIAVNRDLDIFD